MTELQRCSMCKCNKLLSLFKVRENTGKILKTCIKCSKRYKCPHCDNTFPAKGRLVNHINEFHLKIKTFECYYENCKYKCSRKEYIQIHIDRIHLKTKNFKCSYESCNKKFYTKKYLQSHIEKKHNKDYSKSIIYKIECKDENIKDFYIGSTSDIIDRTKNHKRCCNELNRKGYNNKIYKTIRENGGWDNWKFIEIEKYNANDKNHLLNREGYWIKILKPTLNKVIPSRTVKEWCEDNKEKIIIYKKKYYEEHKEDISIKERKRREENKEEILIKERKRREENKEEHNELFREKIRCEICDIEINRSSLWRHKKSQKHLKNLSNQ